MSWLNGTAKEALALAQKAMSAADAADAKREAHERLCGERWQQLRDSIRDMIGAMNDKHAENRTSLAKLWWSILVGMGVTICGMAGLIITLTVHGH